MAHRLAPFLALGLLSLAACSAVDPGPMSPDPGSSGVAEPAAATGDDAGATTIAPPPDAGAFEAAAANVTWKGTIYPSYFAPLSAGNCAQVGCHQTTRDGFRCGTSADACYQGLVTAGLVDPANPKASVLADPSTSPLAWFGGTMPGGRPATNPKAVAEITAWVAAGAKNE